MSGLRPPQLIFVSAVVNAKGIPGSLDLATYEIYLSSSPDAYYNAALSD